LSSDRLARSSQHMAAVTLCFIVVIVLLNAASWFYPPLRSHSFAFSLTHEVVWRLQVDIDAFPWWQKLGSVALSSLPLLALATGLWHLRALFQCYGRREYFSPAAAVHLGWVGRFVALWVMLRLLSRPLLSAWVTMHEPPGHRTLVVAIGSPEIVALFVAASIMVIARILRRASELDSENKLFI
jgi:Protein of unknown function (DUF2975)